MRGKKWFKRESQISTEQRQHLWFEASGSQFVAFPKRFMDALLLDCINLNTVLILSTDYLRQKNKFFSNPVFGTERSLLPCSKSYSSRQTEGKKHCAGKRGIRAAWHLNQIFFCCSSKTSLSQTSIVQVQDYSQLILSYNRDIGQCL